MIIKNYASSPKFLDSLLGSKISKEYPYIPQLQHCRQARLKTQNQSISFSASGIECASTTIFNFPSFDRRVFGPRPEVYYIILYLFSYTLNARHAV